MYRNKKKLDKVGLDIILFNCEESNRYDIATQFYTLIFIKCHNRMPKLNNIKFTVKTKNVLPLQRGLFTKIVMGQ